LQEHEVTHQDLVSSISFGHCDPAAESEWRGCGDTCNRYLQVIAWDVHLQNVVFEVALFSQGRQHLLVFRRNILRFSERGQR
jgi:hypothetical protein